MSTSRLRFRQLSAHINPASFLVWLAASHPCSNPNTSSRRSPMASLAYVISAICVSLLLSPASGIDFDYPAVFNFGDSNSDTGDLIAAGIGDPLLPPNGRAYFSKPAGRFCDGRLIIDFLMDAMDMPFLNAYLDSVGAPSFQKGCNFAAAGSTILPATKYSVSPFSFGIQVAQFFRFKNQVLQLQTKGARKFWIHNTGPLGCLSQNIVIFGKDPSKLDKFGCVSSHNRAAKLFNIQLHTLCTKLRGVFADATITYIDVFTIKFNLIANFSRYGFENPIAACCGYSGLPLNYDPRIACGQTKVLKGRSATAKACDDATEYINWDGIHYTEAANLHVSSQILTGRYSDPPFADQMPFALKLKF
ncbi:hypothetical protein C4D60_Mb06t24390 [Musa balbisiana]|uniref:GDSL esterase/lipase n=1 Tax=Musa balbisiana TaxID=52838 RepID=A0A4S8IQC7_MUSBA|nr:hypothetical protein C4D60_Mb06t24390 [Musa balbisiana]